MIVMPFGKHKHAKLVSVPHGYLKWVLANVKGHKPLKKSIEIVLRGGTPTASKKEKKIMQDTGVSKGICRTCGEVTRVSTNDWHHASPPRCIGCGGLLDRPRKTTLNSNSKKRKRAGHRS